tara:strand:- start:3333 stop:5336 length:2004 start_codon:yes stop_codon:yes gene_type:complete
MAGIFDALGFRTETTPNINPLTVDVNPTMDTKVPNSESVLNLIKATPINSPALRTYGESFYGVNKDINKALIAKGYKPSSGMTTQTQQPIVSNLGQIDVSVPGVDKASTFDAGIAQLPIGVDFENMVAPDGKIIKDIPNYMTEIRNLSKFVPVDKDEGSEDVIVPGIGDKKAGLGGIGFGGDTGAGSDKRAELEARIEANKDIIADERRMQQGQLGQDPEEAPKSKYQQNQDSLQALFASAMDEQKQLFGDLADETGDKTIEDYKADFQKATGINVSGEPDNKMALMSLGLSLMQNKAGKGFDLSKILTSVGQAGEAAMPAFQKAKDDARAGQIAAGKFALQQTQADEKTRLALAKEKRLALSALSKEFRTKAENRFLKKEDHLNALEQKELTESIKLRAAQIKAGATANELAGKGFEVEPIDGQKQLVYRKALKKNATGRSVSVFTMFAEDIRKFKNADFNISRARARLGGLKEIVSKFVPSTGTGTVPFFKIVGDELKNYAVAFGVDPKVLFKNSKVVGIDKDGNIIKKNVNVSDRDLASSIRDSLILEYKKFLTQETGNGISNQDVQRLDKAIGKLDIFGNPAAAISKIEEIDGIFQKTQDQIGNVFTAFKDEDNYMTTEQYEKAMGILGGSEDNKVYKFGKSGKSFNVRAGEGGRMIYSLKTK